MAVRDGRFVDLRFFRPFSPGLVAWGFLDTPVSTRGFDLA